MYDENKFGTSSLMIGYLVYNHRNWVCPVVSIDSPYIDVIAGHYGKCAYNIEDVSPIQITKEILDKNFTVSEEYEDFEDTLYDIGFGFYIYKDKDKENEFCICNGYDVGFWNELCYITNVQYVNELQHFLRLIKYHKKINI